MAKCEVCGNEYDKAFEVVSGGERHTFDSFECAIQALAPTCSHCSCRIIGHGIEAGENFYCCASCARRHGEERARDRVGVEDTMAESVSDETTEILSRDYDLRGTP